MSYGHMKGQQLTIEDDVVAAFGLEIVRSAWGNSFEIRHPNGVGGIHLSKYTYKNMTDDDMREAIHRMLRKPTANIKL